MATTVAPCPKSPLIMAAAKFSSYRPTSKLWASFCSSLGEAWPRPALCTAARSHAATHGRQFWCWAASRRCARGRYEACNFSLRRHHYQVLVVCLGLQSTGCQMPPTTPMPKTCLRREHIRPRLAPVHRSRRAGSHRCAALQLRQACRWLPFSLGCPPWRGWTVGRDLAPGLPSSYWPLPTNKSEQTKGGGQQEQEQKKTSPRKSGAANPLSLCVPGEEP